MTSRRRLPLGVVVLLVFAAAGLLSWGGYWLLLQLNSQFTMGPVQVNVLELWNNGSYDEIIEYGKEELKVNPLDSGTLIFSGFSFFHKGIAEVTIEKKLAYIDQAIQVLRKALLIQDSPLRSEIYYILGKAYFHKGKYYSDLSIAFLKRALEMNYTASDVFEYLGLAYSQIGKYNESNDYFMKAAESNASDLLLWTLGQTNFQMGKFDTAISYLKNSINKTQDRNLEQRCRFLLGEIYMKTKQWDKAESEYNLILSKNANSADAHYFLGEIFLQQGNKEKARAEWRKAFKIDPLHFNANQRLFN